MAAQTVEVVDVSDVAQAEAAVPPAATVAEAEAATALMAKHGVDAKTAMRFSKARKGDLKKADPFLAEDVKWRAEYKPQDIKQSDIPAALPSGCWRLLGQSAEGMGGGSGGGFPVLFIDLSLWNPSDYDVDEYGRYVCYFLEAMCRIGDRFIVIFDMKGWKLSHALHLRKVKRLVSTLQDHYPERLEAAVLMRAPGIFASAWAVIKGFIDPVTATKVRFTAGTDSELAAHKQLGVLDVVPTSYGGGNAKQVPVPNVPGEPDIEGAPSLHMSS
jgi:hypothetical protein